jgi:uncharacterized membrane protein
MEELQHVALVLLAIGALVSVTALAAGSYEFRTGRVFRFPYRHRRKVPATSEDVRKNGLALVINDLGALLMNMVFLLTLLLYDVRSDSFIAISYFALGAAGFTAGFLCLFISRHIRGEVHYQERGKPRPAPSAQP